MLTPCLVSQATPELKKLLTTRPGLVLGIT
jgi:hypothetical protein